MGIMGTRPRRATATRMPTPIEQAILSSRLCQAALGMTSKDRTGVLRAYSLKPIFDQATQIYGGDPRMLGAIALNESNADPDVPDAKDGGQGMMQLTRQPHVSSAQAHDVNFSVNYAAKLLAENGRFIARRFPQFSSRDRLLATAASFNLNPYKNLSGNPATIDAGSAGGAYGHRVLALMNCFPLLGERCQTEISH